MKALIAATLITLSVSATSAFAGQISDWKKVPVSDNLECMLAYDESDNAYRECRIDALEALHRPQFERRFNMRSCSNMKNIDKHECRGFQEVLDEKMDKELIVLHRIFN